jgi:hypothetical protein
MGTAYFTIYGKRELCEILHKLPAGTYDIQVLRTGKCFRVSGFGSYTGA